MNLAVKERPSVETQGQAIQLANDIERVEATCKAMKAQLKSFVDDHGAVETKDKVWDYSSSISWQIEPKVLKAMAKDIVLEGKNPWEFLTLPKGSLEKLGWGEEILSQYGQKKETKRFSSHKK